MKVVGSHIHSPFPLQWIPKYSMKTASTRKNESTLPKNIWLRWARNEERGKKIELFSFFQSERYWMLVSSG